MTATVEMPICCVGLRRTGMTGRSRGATDAGRWPGFIASKSVRLPTLIEPSVMPRPVSKKGSSIVPDGDRLAPIRLTCPPTAKAFSDFAIVPGPGIPPPSDREAVKHLARGVSADRSRRAQAEKTCLARRRSVYDSARSSSQST